MRRDLVASRHTAPTMTRSHTHTPSGKESILVPVLWGFVIGVLQAGSPLAVRWLDAATVYSLELALIAARLLVLGYTGHGLKDAWQPRRQYVADTRWWPRSAPPSTGRLDVADCVGVGDRAAVPPAGP